MAQLYRAPSANYIQTTLNGAITNSATTITLNATTNMQAPGYVVINRVNSSGTATPNAREVVSYTGIAGNDLTGCTRGADNSTARSHSNGAIVETMPTVGMWNDLRDAFANAFTADSVLKALISPVSISDLRLIRVDVSSIASIAQLHLTRGFISTLTIPTLINASGASVVGLYPSGASGAVLTNVGNDKVPVFATAPSASTDGWTASTDTWTYASATSFTIAGVDRTTTFTPGTRIKLTQTSAKYFVVTSSSFSTNTTVNITGGTDYTLANAAITSPYISYQANPQGYPGWFAYTVTWGGFSADPTGVTAKFAVVGRTCHVQILATGNGTSNATSFTYSIPIAAATAQNGIPTGTSFDNGSALTTIGVTNVAAASTTATAYPAPNQGAWTGSAGKNIQVSIFYQI